MFEFMALSRQSKYRTVLCSQTSGRKNKLEDITAENDITLVKWQVMRRPQDLTVQRSTLIGRARLL